MLVLYLLLCTTEAFLMTRVEPGKVDVREGETVQLLCQVILR